MKCSTIVAGARRGFSFGQKLKNGPLKSIIELYANSKVRRMIFASYFMFCVTSLSYYVTGKFSP